MKFDKYSSYVNSNSDYFNRLNDAENNSWYVRYAENFSALPIDA